MGTSLHHLTILQHNLGKGKVATAELRVAARRANASILLLQEPWVVRTSVVSGLGSLSTRILTGTSDDAVWACIAILDSSIDVTVLRHLSNSFCVCAHIVSRHGSCYLVSLYCQPSVDIQIPLNHLRLIHETLGPVPILVGADVNAKSPLWFSSTTDPRGRLLEDLGPDGRCATSRATRQHSRLAMAAPM